MASLSLSLGYEGRFTKVTSPKSLTAWKLGLVTSHGSQVPKSLEVNMCNLSRWKHGSWDLPLHTGPRSQVPSHLRSIHAISAVESMEVGTCHFTWVPGPKVTWGQSVQSRPFRAWKLGLATVPGPKFQVWHGCLHGGAFKMWGLGLVSRLGSSKI